jgi:ATP-dependent DNA helicase RecG
MTRDELLRLIAQGEGQQLDFKEETIKPGKLAETLVAFANAEGGLIVIGVDDQGRVAGVSDLKRATDNVVEAIGNCSPPLGIGLPQSVEMAPGATALVIEIPPQLPRVYHAHGRYLRRSGSMNMALDEAALRRLLYERGELSFEAEPVAEAGLADLDDAKVNGFRQRYEGIYGRSLALANRDLLLAMGCLTRDSRPTVAGLLLFGRDIQRFFFEPHISIARYRGNTFRSFLVCCLVRLCARTCPNTRVLRSVRSSSMPSSIATGLSKARACWLRCLRIVSRCKVLARCRRP